MTGVGEQVVYAFGEFTLDPAARTLTARGKEIHLPAKEFDTLLYFIENRGRILSKDELMTAIWQDTFVEESNLAQYVSRLRKILDENGHKHIQTLPKRGYRFDSDVVAVPIRSKQGRRAFVWGGVVILLTVIAGGIAWRYAGRSKAETGPPTARPSPVAITDGKQDDGVMAWTADNRIRFLHSPAPKRYESWIMDLNGTNAHRETPNIKGFLSGNWSPDGKKVFFMKESDGKTTYLANADGSGEVALPLLVGASDWSPDSSSFVYETKLEEGNTDIFLYTVATHQNVNLTRSKNFDADPAFAPDGRHVVYVSSRDDNADIYMMDMTGRDVRRLTDHPAFDSHPGISPDGTQLLFLSNRDGRDAQLYLKDLGDDSAPVRLTDMPGVEGNNSKCWSPDGTQIVFTAEVEGKDRVFVMNVDPFPVTAAIVDPEAALDFPRVSPDGSRILLQARMPDNSFELRIADLAGGSSQTIYRSEAGLPPTFLLAAEWSPDGSKIIFDDQVGGNTDIYSLNLNGKSRTRLTDDPMPDLSPSLSPDGSTIYFVRDFYGQPKIYQMDPDGRDQRPVHEGGGGYEMSPSVSPDGKTLLLSADRLDSRRMGLDLYELPLDASGEERLVVSRPLHEVEAVFSRDGKKIAFVANSDDNPEIYIANSDGSGAVRITRNQAIDQRPVFSMDGTALFFSSNRGGKSAIYRVELPQ